MESWVFRRMLHTNNLRWIKKTLLNSYDGKLAELGAERLREDQAALLDLVRDARWPPVQSAALMQISDPAVIDSIAEGNYLARTRQAAIKRSVNQQLLCRLAIKEMDLYTAAVETMTDETLLTQVAKTAKWEKAGALAFNKLTDDLLRRAVCGEDARPENRLNAAIELDDQQTIERFVKDTAENNGLWHCAVSHCSNHAVLEAKLQDKKLTIDQKEVLFKRLGRNEEAAYIRLCNGHIIFDALNLLNQITRSDLLMDLVQNTTDWYIRPEAAKRLVKADFPNKMEWMRDTAVHDCSIEVRLAAYEGLPECNQKAVFEYGRLSNENYGIRLAAAESLMDIFEEDRFALTVMGREALRLIEQRRQTYDTPTLDEIAWNGNYADEPGYHTDIGIGIEFRKYNGSACMIE